MKCRECPSCGNKDDNPNEESMIMSARQDSNKQFVLCLKCGFEGPPYKKMDDAIRAWNRVKL